MTGDSAHSLYSQQSWLMIPMAISGSLPYPCAWLGGALGVVGVHLCVYCLPYLIVSLNVQQTKLVQILFSWMCTSVPKHCKISAALFSTPSHCTVMELHTLNNKLASSSAATVAHLVWGYLHLCSFHLPPYLQRTQACNPTPLGAEIWWPVSMGPMHIMGREQWSPVVTYCRERWMLLVHCIRVSTVALRKLHSQAFLRWRERMGCHINEVMAWFITDARAPSLHELHAGASMGLRCIPGHFPPAYLRIYCHSRKTLAVVYEILVQHSDAHFHGNRICCTVDISKCAQICVYMYSICNYYE